MYLLWIGEGASDHYMMEEVRKHVERIWDVPPPLRRSPLYDGALGHLAFAPAP
jgi:hypothetical protein